jgi:hypothetical protein
LESEKLQKNILWCGIAPTAVAVAILMSSSSVVLGKICLISLLRERFEVAIAMTLVEGWSTSKNRISTRRQKMSKRVEERVVDT